MCSLTARSVIRAMLLLWTRSLIVEQALHAELWHHHCDRICSLMRSNCARIMLFCSVSLSREAEVRRGILGTPHRGLKNVFQFLRGAALPSILCIRREVPRACLTLIYQHAMARIAAASEACRSARCTVYTSWEEAAAPRSACLCLKCIPGFRWSNRVAICLP